MPEPINGHSASTVGPRGIRWDFTFNVGTMIHMLTLLIAAFMVWHAVDKQQAVQQERLDNLTVQMHAIDTRTERIENWMHEAEYLRGQPVAAEPK